MLKLYDIVKKVINSDSIIEAEQILYGKEGIVIASDEYYKNIISNFIQKKEIIIRKENNRLVFDLNNYNDIWNIIFIGEYIKQNDILFKQYNEILNEISDINKKLVEIKKKHQMAKTNEEHSNINKEFQLLNNIKSKKQKELDDLKSIKDVFYNIDWIDLENETDTIKQAQNIEILKQSINIIHQLRNSFAHNSINVENIIQINDGKFNVKIPIEYLEGFNKGRIIADEKDKVLVEKTNDISFPLLEALKFDIKKIDSFFYNIEPSYLDYILEKVDYNIQKLYQLSPLIFRYKKEVKILIKNGLDIYSISLLESSAFLNVKKTIELLNKRIDVTKLPSSAFIYFDSTKRFIELNIDITQLPNSAFEHLDITIKFVDNNIDVTNFPRYAFLYPGETIKFIDNNIDVTKLPEAAFVFSDETIKFIEMGIDVTELPNSAFEHSEAVLNFLDKKIDITKLPPIAFAYPKATINFLEIGLDITKLSFDAFIRSDLTIRFLKKNTDITKLPPIAFTYPKATIKFLQKKIDITSLPEIAFIKLDTTIRFTEMGIDVIKLPEAAFEYPDITIMFIEKNIDITKLSFRAFQYPENTIKFIEMNIDVTKLPPDIFAMPHMIYTAKTILKNNIDITTLPLVAFEFPRLVLKLHAENIDITKISNAAFIAQDFTMQLLVNGIDITKIPDKLYINANSIKITTLKNILVRVNNDYNRLNTLPIEFFTCKNEQLLDKMFQRYNANISKSIFGIKNPKIIATLIYANTVLSDYNKTVSTIDMNIQPDSIIATACNDCFKYQKTIEENIGKPFTSQAFIEQFKLIDENHIIRSEDDIKKTILTKIRNASEHFRFKPVKDNNGKILEDKIYIYDEDNRGINNFNLIIDLKDLIKIIREVELQNEKIQNQTKNDSSKKR